MKHFRLYKYLMVTFIVLNAKTVLGGQSIPTSMISGSYRVEDNLYAYVRREFIEKSSYETSKNVNSKMREKITMCVSSDRVKDTKMGKLYHSFVDASQTDSPAATRSVLKKIDDIKDKNEIPALLAFLNTLGLAGPLMYVHVDEDLKNLGKFVYVISSPIPPRYMEKYTSEINEKAIALLKIADPSPNLPIANMLSLEGNIAANVKLDDKKPQEIEKAELPTMLANYNLSSYLSHLQISDNANLVIKDPEYFNFLDKLISSTSLDMWKLYFKYKFLQHYQSLMPQKKYDFRKYQAISLVMDIQSDDVAQLCGFYDPQYVGSENYNKVLEMYKNIILAFKTRITAASWMSQETKDEAFKKLDNMRLLIAYPSKWRDYSDLEIKPNDLVANLININQFIWKYSIYQVSQKDYRLEWPITIPFLSAIPVYLRHINTIVLPIMLLQPPIFTDNDAINYGRIGVEIAHEISHAFDTPRWIVQRSDIVMFNIILQDIEKQYNDFGVNGKATLRENFADNVGLAMAFQAFKDKIARSGEEKTNSDKISQYKQFYIGSALSLQNEYRGWLNERIYEQPKADFNYAPYELRVNIPAKNQADFYTIFGIKQGDGMYLPPARRVTVW